MKWIHDLSIISVLINGCFQPLFQICQTLQLQFTTDIISRQTDHLTDTQTDKQTDRPLGDCVQKLINEFIIAVTADTFMFQTNVCRIV